MRTISQRELRNDNAEVIRGVERGESFTVTRRGVPIARLTPIGTDELACARPASGRVDFRSLPRIQIDESSAEALDELRGDR